MAGGIAEIQGFKHTACQHIDLGTQAYSSKRELRGVITSGYLHRGKLSDSRAEKGRFFSPADKEKRKTRWVEGSTRLIQPLKWTPTRCYLGN